MIKGINGWTTEIIDPGYGGIFNIQSEFDNEVYYDNELKIEIAKHLLELSQKYEICELLPKELRESLNIDVTEVHLNEIRQSLEEIGAAGVMNRLNTLFPKDLHYLQFSNMSFYENNQIVNRSVSSIDNIDHVAYYDYLAFDSQNQIGLYSSRTNDIQRHKSSFSLPVRFSCSGIYKNIADLRDNIWIFYFQTNTDIWFPKVVQMKKRLSEYLFEDIGEFDNLPLAINHTPRLNAFLEGVVKLTKSYGGRVKVSNVPYLNPITMTLEDVYTEYGIKMP